MTDEPAHEILTWAINDDWVAADHAVAQWIDSGNSDVLIESLLDTALQVLDQYAHELNAASDTASLWRRLMYTKRLSEELGGADDTA